jgi:HSP20 family protein
MKYSLINNGLGSSWLSDFFDVNVNSLDKERFNNFSSCSNIEELENSYSITLEVPGMTKKDIKITIDNKILKIKGLKKINNKMNSTINKEFAANIDIDSKASSARVENGMLTINLAKARSASNEIKIE